MSYLLALSLVSNVAFACFVLRYLAARDRQDVAERSRYAETHQELWRTHREEVAALHQARVEEIANLLQRIQAPEQAVVSHVADTSPPDQPAVNPESDDEYWEAIEQRQRQIAELGVLG